MDEKILKRMNYLASDQLKKLSVQKKGRVDFQPIHLETVKISPNICFFEWEGRQEFQIGDEFKFLFDIEDRCLSARAMIVWVAKCELLDEGYQYKTWFSYAAKFDGELNGDFFQRIAGDPAKSRPLVAEYVESLGTRPDEKTAAPKE